MKNSKNLTIKNTVSAHQTRYGFVAEKASLLTFTNNLIVGVVMI